MTALLSRRILFPLLGVTILVLMAFLLACGGDTATDEPEPTSTEQETATTAADPTPEPTATPEASPPPEPTAATEPTLPPEPTATTEPTATPAPEPTPEPTVALVPEDREVL